MYERHRKTAPPTMGSAPRFLTSQKSQRIGQAAHYLGEPEDLTFGALTVLRVVHSLNGMEISGSDGDRSSKGHQRQPRPSSSALALTDKDQDAQRVFDAAGSGKAARIANK